MASRMAVPPRESILAKPCSSSLRLLAKGWSRKASSLKFTTKTSSCGLEALTRASAARTQKNSRLLSRRIIPLSRYGPQGRQSLRLHQRHFHFAILPVPFPVDRGVAEDVLVAQLDSNLRRHIRQLIQVFHGEVPP